MDKLFMLPETFRMIAFIDLFALTLVMLVCLIVIFMFEKKRTLTYRILYAGSMMLCLMVYVFTRTPIVAVSDESCYIVLNYLTLILAALIVASAVWGKTYAFLVDAILIIFNIPLFFEWSYFELFYCLTLVLLTFRVVSFAFETYNSYHNMLGVHSVKLALDTLSDGVIFANSKGQVIFINLAMHNYFNELHISEYFTSKKIWDKIKLIARSDGRVLSDDSITVVAGEKSLNFTRITKQKNDISQIICYDVTDEECVLKKIEDAERESQKQQSELKQALMDINQIEKDKEVLRLKASLHDAMGQRLSILHGFLSDANETADLVKIKQLIMSMLPDMYGVGKTGITDKINELISTYSLIGVRLKINGNIAELAGKAQFALILIRESATNAVKHGGATEVEVNIFSDKTNYIISISNNGTVAETIVEGNGIEGMRYHINHIGGVLDIKSTPVFTVLAKFPKN